MTQGIAGSSLCRRTGYRLAVSFMLITSATALSGTEQLPAKLGEPRCPGKRVMTCGEARFKDKSLKGAGSAAASKSACTCCAVS